MPTQHNFVQAIRALSGSCSPQAPQTVDIQATHFRAIGEISDVGTLAAELLALRFMTPQTTQWALPELKALAKALAERVQYLLEPLSIIEVDDDSATVQLRSTQPAKLDKGRAYYEVLARPGSLHLSRYLAPTAVPRQTTTMQLTYEQLNRLLTDVESVVKP